MQLTCCAASAPLGIIVLFLLCVRIIMKILVIGTGYVGLVTGACFAEMGHHVLCLDIDSEKIAFLKCGKVPIFEPGLDEMVKRNSDAGRLKFTTSYKEGVDFATVCFIAVSTPPCPDGSADISYLKSAARSIAEHMNSYKILVNKSTVPLGTTAIVEEVVESVLLQRKCSCVFDVVSNPEFLKEGDAINDFMKPDRIVIGAHAHAAIEIMKELYAPFNLNHDRLIIMDPLSSEMTKYAANAALASRISFMNEMAAICEEVGADITKVRKGIGSDKRIGYAFLYAGSGYGGSCFPKDIKALRATAQQLDVQTPLLDAVEEVNERQKQVIGAKMAHYFHGDLKNKKIAIWGLAFKPGTDDMREAPALILIRFLVEQGAHVFLFDPIAMKKAETMIKKSPQIHFCCNEFETAEGADAIALMTEWKQFRFIDLRKVRSLMRGRAFFDGRNQYQREEMRELGFNYFSIGQPAACAEQEEVFHVEN